MRKIIVSALAASLVGCAGLLIEPHDSPGLKAGKFTARALLVFPTLSLSEIAMDDIKRQRQSQQRAAEWARYIAEAERNMLLASTPEEREHWRRVWEARRAEHQAMLDRMGALVGALLAQPRPVFRPTTGGHPQPVNCQGQVQPGGQVRVRCQ